MSSTSQKHRNFVSEPMGKKLVTEMPGVGKSIGGRLSNAGYSHSSAVLGQYLVNRNEDSFKAWFSNTSGANSKQANDCYQSLNAWSDNFL